MKKEYSEKLYKWSSQVVNVGSSVKSTRKYGVIKVCSTLTQSVCGCVCVCVWIQAMIMVQTLVPWETICQPQALDTVLEGADPAWLFLDYFSYLLQQFPVSRVHHQGYFCGFPFFLEGMVTSFLDCNSYIMLFTHFRNTATQCVWIYSQSCVTITPISYTIFLFFLFFKF